MTTIAGTGEPYGESGDGGPPKVAIMNPVGVVTDPAGNLYVVDACNDGGCVRRISPRHSRLSAFAQVDQGAGETLFPDEGDVGYVFDSAGLHDRTISLSTGVVLNQLTYDSSRRLISIEDTFGNVTEIQRDSSGFPTAIVSPDGLETMLTVDSNEFLTEVTFPDNTGFDFEYGNGGLLTRKVDPKGNNYNYTFDSLGWITDAEDDEGGHFEFSSWTDDEGSVYAQRTTGEGNVTTYKDESHLETTGYVMETTLPSGDQVVQTRGGDGLSGVKLFPTGAQWEYQYGLDEQYGFDFMTEQVESMPPDGQGQVLAREAIYERTYDELDGSIQYIGSAVTMNGKMTTVERDILASMTTVTSPEGRQIVAFYNPGTLLTERVETPCMSGSDPLYPSVFAYDSRGRLVSAAVDVGGQSRRQILYGFEDPNDKGQLSSATDPLGNTTFFDYDAVGQLAVTYYPDGTSIELGRDANGNVTSLTTPQYPSLPHLFSYNRVDSNVSYTTPGGRVYQYRFDRDRRLTGTTFPSGKAFENVYLNSRLERVLAPDGTMVYTYLPGDRVESVTRYDEMAQATGQVAYGYAGTLLTSETVSGTLSSPITFERDYNNDFDVTDFRYVRGGVVEKSVHFDRDLDGLLTVAGEYTMSRDPDYGLPLSVEHLGTTVLWRDFDVDGYGDLNGEGFGSPSSPFFWWSVTQRDAAGMIKRKQEMGRAEVEYTFDSMGRLERVWEVGQPEPSEEYWFDLNGRRTSEVNRARLPGDGLRRSYLYDEDDRLLAVTDSATGDPLLSFGYDQDGYRISKTDVVTGEQTAYVYSSLGELTTVELPSGDLVSYSYDPLGRRASRSVNGVVTDRYVWSGNSLLAVYDGSDNLVQWFDYADARMPVAMERHSGGQITTYLLGYDQVGSLRAVYDEASDTLVKEVVYDSFGNVLLDSDLAFDVPFGFAGGLYDPLTGLVKFGVRDYDPDIGRWLAREPLRLLSGLDAYAYCMGDPIDFIDPSGLQQVPATGEIQRIVDTAIIDSTTWQAFSGNAGRNVDQARRYVDTKCLGTVDLQHVVSAAVTGELQWSLGGILQETNQYLHGQESGWQSEDIMSNVIGRTARYYSEKNDTSIGQEVERLLTNAGIEGPLYADWEHHLP